MPNFGLAQEGSVLDKDFMNQLEAQVRSASPNAFSARYVGKVGGCESDEGIGVAFIAAGVVRTVLFDCFQSGIEVRFLNRTFLDLDGNSTLDLVSDKLANGDLRITHAEGSPEAAFVQTFSNATQKHYEAILRSLWRMVSHDI